MLKKFLIFTVWSLWVLEKSTLLRNLLIGATESQTGTKRKKIHIYWRLSTTATVAMDMTDIFLEKGHTSFWKFRFLRFYSWFNFLWLHQVANRAYCKSSVKLLIKYEFSSFCWFMLCLPRVYLCMKFISSLSNNGLRSWRVSPWGTRTPEAKIYSRRVRVFF